ncbi:MAG TPA: hypothetical protein PLP61_09935 [Nocardioides sp.]|uniref:hypothetical protein n=1 Tax=Nocardioides sp. TaxID=35761 RepID=UPI002C2F5895|nr:hypothetical protein [Nocardioides sp.]HQR27347.1 hypothetical protein [Nocardioides sp.]
MIGPLPTLYRRLTAVAVLLVCIATGAWLAHSTSVPAVVAAGAAVGALAGMLVAFALLHDFSRRPAPVRARRR